MKSYHLFDVIGIELEYMIVRDDTLHVYPVCDKLLQRVSGSDEKIADVDFDDMGWSNELVNHVVEFKTLDPREMKRLPELQTDFQKQVDLANELLKPMGGRLMPGAMHPWMNPFTETQLWPHHYSEIYECYNRIFDCRGHGWSNLQSMHINLPFAGNDEFGKLHAAIRFLMPVMPALTASSPVADSEMKPAMDFRLRTYQGNSARIPQVSGKIIPESVYTKKQYDDEIFQPLYKAIAPFDSEGIMQEEWLNSRGAIARFDRSAIEIRILDIQECTAADIQIAILLSEVLRMLTEERWCSIAKLMEWPVEPLFGIFTEVVEKGGDAIIRNKEYLKCLGVDKDFLTAHDLCIHLYEATGKELPAVEHIIKHGNLSTRILRALKGDASPKSLKTVYERMCDCLEKGQMFS